MIKLTNSKLIDHSMENMKELQTLNGRGTKRGIFFLLLEFEIFLTHFWTDHQVNGTLVYL